MFNDMPRPNGGGSGGEKEITSIDPQLTDISASAYTIPASGMVYIRIINASNNAPTLTLDGVIQTTPTSILVESKYQWIYAFYVKTGQVIKATFGSGTGRATYLSLIRMR